MILPIAMLKRQLLKLNQKIRLKEYNEWKTSKQAQKILEKALCRS